MYVEVRRMNTIPIGIDGILANFGHLATRDDSRPLSRDISYKTNKTKATVVSEHSGPASHQ
jgi:hypothetical protein